MSDIDESVEIIDTKSIDISPNSTACDPLAHHPIYMLAQWRERITQDGRISLLVLLPSGYLDEDGVSAKLSSDNPFELNLTWPAIFFDHHKLTNAMVTCYTDLDVSNTTLLAQGLMEYVEQFQTKQGHTIVSSCTTDLRSL